MNITDPILHSTYSKKKKKLIQYSNSNTLKLRNVIKKIQINGRILI